MNIAEKIEKLCTATIKLYKVKERQSLLVDKRDKVDDEECLQSINEELAELSKKDIDLCKLRGRLKDSINEALQGFKTELKDYGEESV